MPRLLYSTVCGLSFLILIFGPAASSLCMRRTFSVGIPPPNVEAVTRSHALGFQRFVKSVKFDFWGENGATSPFSLHVRGKPMIYLPTVDKSKLPKDVGLDYENILRSNDPNVINYNTRLTDFPGVNVYKLDNIYGRIYDPKVLIRQLRYFLERDDFHSVPRLLRDNKYVLSRQHCYAFYHDIFHLLHVRLKYRLPEKETLDEDARFLVARYVSQHILQQDSESRRYYCWLQPGEIPPKVPEYDPQYVEPKATPEKPMHVKDTIAYRKIMQRLNNLDEFTKLWTLRELYYRLVNSKRKKLAGSLWKHQKLKETHRLGYWRKVRNKVDIDRISPFLTRPFRCTDELAKTYTDHYEQALDKKDLATACWVLKRYTRFINCKNRPELFKKLILLFKEFHSSKKYDLESLRRLRGLYFTTLKQRKVLIKWNEPLLVRDAGKSMKVLYEEQLEAYRKRRDARYAQLAERRGVNLKELEDFSNVYGEDWIPILYPEEFKEQLEKQRQRMEKLRAKVQWLKQQQLEKKKKEEEYDATESSPVE